jgi:hypothetical protein
MRTEYSVLIIKLWTYLDDKDHLKKSSGLTNH